MVSRGVWFQYLVAQVAGNSSSLPGSWPRFEAGSKSVIKVNRSVRNFADDLCEVNCSAKLRLRRREREASVELQNRSQCFFTADAQRIVARGHSFPEREWSGSYTTNGKERDSASRRSNRIRQ